MITGTFEDRPKPLTMYHAGRMHAYPLTFHNHVELIYVREGELSLAVDGHSTTLHTGDLSICFPYMLHQSEAADAKVLVLVFDPALCVGMINTLSTSKPADPFLRREQIPAIVPQLLEGLWERVKAGHGEDAVITPAYLTVLMGEIVQRQTLVEQPLNELSLSRQILSYCMRNYRQDLSLDSVAQALAISRTQAARTFQRLELNFRSYLNDLRISAARQLLTQTNRPITDIVYESGFVNQGTFNRLFLKSCGMTPREYRARHGDEGAGSDK
ncbi:MAG: helix-turn-helix domain-containing protein [Oscillospiraceae bacterium]|nr:helix-turn-helix domain-containing protein [Oscillospiraceae bacterium]